MTNRISDEGAGEERSIGVRGQRLYERFEPSRADSRRDMARPSRGEGRFASAIMACGDSGRRRVGHVPRETCLKDDLLWGRILGGQLARVGAALFCARIHPPGWRP